ncbi:MAG: hypothetical protein HYX39_14310 [Bacteroidetes bacterium]|nr:hypothetical protein [Bacteroidota bacterium]
MNIFDELYNLYRVIDSDLAIIETEARMRPDPILEGQTMRQRELNDQAYFLYMFTRLEEKIRQSTTLLFDAKIVSTTNIEDLRAWEIIKTKQLSLMHLVSFVLVNGGIDYNLVYDFKKQRDKIAHGGLVPAILLSYVHTEMKRLYDLF